MLCRADDRDPPVGRADIEHICARRHAMFVEPDHRGQGLARKSMKKAGADLRAPGVIYAILHATDAGRPFYERMGWARTAEMAKCL